MAFPTFVNAQVCTETVDGTTHSFPAFSGAVVGDVYWVLLAAKKVPNTSWLIDSHPGTFTWSARNWADTTAVNRNVSILYGYGIVETSWETTPLVITSSNSIVVAGVVSLFRGAADQRDTFGTLTNGDQGPLLGSPNNIGLSRTPGSDNPSQQDRVPDRSSNGGLTGDATFVAGYARTGKISFTTISDPIGKGLSQGAPYLATRERDMNWNANSGTRPDGLNTTPFTMLGHAESTDAAGWKVQAAQAYRDIPSSEWQGHNGWAPYIYQGQVGITYWPCGADDFSIKLQGQVPTALHGIRLHV